MSGIRYRGRFAPSPTGPLHFGSLVAAVGSYLEAQSRGGEWLVRMEDPDPPRVVPGAADRILATLEAFGFDWDGEVVCQGRRAEAYHAALHALRKLGRIYPCGCSRREIADSGVAGLEGFVYPGTCRDGLAADRAARTLRLRTDNEVVEFRDGLQGRVCQRLADDIGDFVVYRADRVFCYQLAVVVDDGAQGITHVVRGADLLDSTPRQILLQRLLGLPTPTYLHLPVAVNESGEKLSKQTLAAPVEPQDPLPALVAVLRFLNQNPPEELAEGDIAGFWRWALAHWDPSALPPVRIKRVAG
ncbi:MAG: tRNA glutamyl-Q(34) synthetase GluQRS [Betaproteobacteria bacterium]|nr:tRNA glutamyl-Q(34) synthetase GluQRS [Betaproteobacteria bacterium]